MRRPAAAAAALAVMVLGLAACGGGADTKTTKTVTVSAGAPDGGSPSGFDARAIYARAAPDVVTVISVFPGSSLQGLLGGGSGNEQEGLGSGFVVSRDGEVATNAHVVSSGQGAGLKRAEQVYVRFADGNQVPASIVGVDPNADVALIRVAPDGLTLRPLPLGSDGGVRAGDPVAAIGSPFGEPQSLSVGVVSGLDRSIDSLVQGFQIPGAIQTDAAINHGNSGGPLVDAAGTVIGINSQIQSTSGGGEGVGLAVPVDLVKRSLAQLRAHGHATYAYLGVATAPVFPQLADRFHLGTDHGAWVQSVTPGGPAARAGVKGGSGSPATFQAQSYRPGGDVVTAVDGVELRNEDDLSQAISAHGPGDTVTLSVVSGTRRHEMRVRLAPRPAAGATP